MDDKHILARARRGELDAFEELVRQYENDVYKRQLGYGRHDPPHPADPDF